MKQIVFGIAAAVLALVAAGQAEAGRRGGWGRGYYRSHYRPHRLQHRQHFQHGRRPHRPVTSSGLSGRRTLSPDSLEDRSAVDAARRRSFLTIAGATRWTGGVRIYALQPLPRIPIGPVNPGPR